MHALDDLDMNDNLNSRVAGPLTSPLIVPFACSHAMCSVKASDSYLWFYLARISAMSVCGRVCRPLSRPLAQFHIRPYPSSRPVTGSESMSKVVRGVTLWADEGVPVWRPPAWHPSRLRRQPPVAPNNATHAGSSREAGSQWTTSKKVGNSVLQLVIKLNVH